MTAVRARAFSPVYPATLACQVGPNFDLYWVPLGAGKGGGCVRTSGVRFTIETIPVWASRVPDRGVFSERAIGLSALGRFRLIRYEVRCCRRGTIPDLGTTAHSPQGVSQDSLSARRVLQFVMRS